MSDLKKIAVFLNLSKAQFIGRSDGNYTFIEEVISPYKKIKREEGEGSNKTRFGSMPLFASNNEKTNHNISQNELKSYIKILENKLLSYDDILIFGQGKAKDLLNNHLNESKHFEKKRITLRNSDKITKSQKLAFVRDYWEGIHNA